MATVATAMQQIEVLTAELNSLRQEIVLVKGNHASLHQATVETTQASTTKIGSLESRLEEIANASEGFTGKGRSSPGRERPPGREATGKGGRVHR